MHYNSNKDACMKDSQTIIVTGGAGFVGSHLTKKLLKENSVVHLLLKDDTDTHRISSLLNQSNLHIHSIDLLDKTALFDKIREISPEIIFHLAARGAYHWQNDPYELLESNLFGTLNLIKACEQVPYIKFINVGSSSEYGYVSEPMHEQLPLLPNSYYAVSKAAQSMLAYYEASCNNKPIVTVRLFSVFGPLEDNNKFIPTLFRSIVEKKPISLVDPESAHDYVYIDDVVECLLLISLRQSPQPFTFNIGTGAQTTVQQVVRMAEKISHQKVLSQWRTLADHRWDTHHWVADMQQTSSTLDWKPKYNFESGLKKTWESFAHNSK